MLDQQIKPGDRVVYVRKDGVIRYGTRGVFKHASEWFCFIDTLDGCLPLGCSPKSLATEAEYILTKLSDQ